jgi:hypothetical protein
MCKKELLTYFQLQWQDNDKAVWLLPEYQQLPAYENGEQRHNAQDEIYNFLSIDK